MPEKNKTTHKPQANETTKWFLSVVALIGIVISLLQFVLVRQQVTGFLAHQMQQSVAQAIRQVQQRANEVQYLLESVADIQARNPAATAQAARQFVRITDRDQKKLSQIFLISVKDSKILEKALILDLASQTSKSSDPAILPGLDDAIRQMAAGYRAKTVVLRDSSDSRNFWLIVLCPVSGKPGEQQIIAGFMPLQNLFSEFIALEKTGVIVKFAVSQIDKAYEPLLIRQHEPEGTRLLAPHQAQEKIYLSELPLDVAVTSAPQTEFSLLNLLPYIIFGIGLLLTWALIMYLDMVWKRSAEAADLAANLRKSNEELERRIVDEERMARALRESEQKYRSIFENAGIGICQIAHSGEWLSANRTMAAILGYDNPQELLLAQPDLHGQLFVDPHIRRDWFTRLQTTRQREQEVELYTRGRRRIWISMNGHAVYSADGAIMHFECTMYDITERREAERALRQAMKEADFANRSKSEFLANMSHELRTPLNAIIGFSEIIKDQLFGPAGQPQYIEYSRDIYDSGELLLSLINDILDMSKIEAGKRPLAESDLVVADFVRSVMRLVAVRAKAGRVKLNVHVPPDIPQIRGEEKAIKQILTNLLTNAIKFTPEGGIVTLSAQIADDGRMAITVEDTGIGMKPEDIPVALTPFGQIESVLSRKNQGTGLGLPLTKALVELHGGELKMESEVGKGTSINVLFPTERVVRKPA
ncbi:MAG: ATP-binding protein [Alphaproteobacteria bacterium]|nr:ATP-binding protein [Alphaproteobacteria bacterium]